MADLPGLFVGMVKVFYTASATGTTAGRRPGSWCVVRRWGYRGRGGCSSGSGVDRSGGVSIGGVEYCRGSCDSRVNVVITVSRYAIFLIVLWHEALGYVTLRYGYIGGGRAQRVGQRRDTSETHQQAADSGYFVHFAQVLNALAHVQHVLRPRQALEPI